LFLRRMEYERSVALLLAAIVAVALAPVGLSARVKTYVFDALIVIIIAYALNRISKRRWTPLLALVWFVATVAASTFSIFALIACAVAGVVIVLHPCRDRRVRVTAVGAQAVVVGAYLMASRTRYDTETLRRIWEERSDTYIGFDPNPLHMLVSVWRHVVDVVGVYPGGPVWVNQLCAAAATFGLVVAAVRPRAVVARFFVLVVVVAVVGSITRQFPFGAGQTVPSARTALWFLPMTAYGLAEAAAVLLRRLPRAGPARRSVTAISYGGVALLFVSALAGPPAYALNGSASAAAALEAQMQPGDAVILNAASAFPLAVESNLSAQVVSDTSSVTGLRVVFDDDRVTDVSGSGNVTTSVHAHVSDVDRVFEFRAFNALISVNPLVNEAMRDAGFEPSDVTYYRQAAIIEWTRVDFDAPPANHDDEDESVHRGRGRSGR
jgi:hypothetical protein